MTPPSANHIDNEPNAIAEDGANNTYVAGFIRTPASDADFTLQKYSKDGKLLWARLYNGPGNDVDRARDLALGPWHRSIYVTGESDNGKGNGTTRLAGCDIATIKYSPDGRRLWVRRSNGPFDGEDRPVKALAHGDGSGDLRLFVRQRRRPSGMDAAPAQTPARSRAHQIQFER